MTESVEAAAELALTWLIAGAAVWVLAVLDQLVADVTNGRGWSSGVLATPGRETLRALLKESRPLQDADRLLWPLAPLLLIALAGALLALLPFPDTEAYSLPAGLTIPLLGFVLAGFVTFAAGWATRSGFALIAAVRALGIVVACAVPLALSLLALAVAGASLELGDLVAAQQQGLWYAAQQPLGFGLYLFCTLVMAGWGPVRGSASLDLAGGVEAEMSGARLLVWRVGRYLLLLAAATFAVPLYLGGGAGPWLSELEWVLVKSLLVATLLLGIHHRVPSFDFAQLMSRGWRILVPLALLNLLWALTVAYFGPFWGGSDGIGR